MFDPAALGTLLIGLEANRLADERPSRPTRRRRPRAALRLMATALRRAADRLERPVVREPAGQS